MCRFSIPIYLLSFLSNLFSLASSLLSLSISQNTPKQVYVFNVYKYIYLDFQFYHTFFSLFILIKNIYFFFSDFNCLLEDSKDIRYWVIVWMDGWKKIRKVDLIWELPVQVVKSTAILFNNLARNVNCLVHMHVCMKKYRRDSDSMRYGDKVLKVKYSQRRRAVHRVYGKHL